MILCVDPDGTALAGTQSTLEDAGFETVGCRSQAGARELLDGDVSVDCLVTEYDLPDGTGLELAADVRTAAPDAACILFTDVAIADVDTTAFGETIAEYLGKEGPDADAELVDLVGHSLAFRTQTAYPLPENEDARLEALDRYAVDPADLGATFDRLTQLATALFDVRSAAVGLIDTHEERFLSCNGASFDPMAREDTICTYAILETGVTVVENVADDPRFSDNEGLASAGIRFYAGAPVVTSSGAPIGTFCIHDDEPRTFSEPERERLTLLAEETMEQLELQRRLRETTDRASQGGDAGGR